MNKPTRDEAERKLQRIVDLKLDLDHQWESLTEIVGATAESSLGRVVWAQFNFLSDTIAESIGISSESMDWFVWDNEMGEHGLSHSLPDGTIRDVDSIGDFLDVMGY